MPKTNAGFLLITGLLVLSGLATLMTLGLGRSATELWLGSRQRQRDS